MVRGEPDARHRPRALVVDHDAVAPMHDLAELQPFDHDILHVAVPIDADSAVGDVRRCGEGGVADEARLAVGPERLAGLPCSAVPLKASVLNARSASAPPWAATRLLHQLHSDYFQERHFVDHPVASNNAAPIRMRFFIASSPCSTDFLQRPLAEAFAASRSC